MRCAKHPAVETSLRCGKCDTPICPKCMVETPVGMRCRECAGLRRLPVFEISARHYLTATGAGAGLAVVFGLAWTVVRLFVPFSGFLNFFIALGAGYGIGELVGRSVNRKRGAGLALMGGLAALACYGLSVAVFPAFFGFRLFFSLWDVLYAAAAIATAVNQLR
ncbi:MAG: hypothetical protein HYX95_00770 [Chloroflexi bacterium]|nr:hypothetical protein [Chloroflexota bacterium]